MFSFIAIFALFKINSEYEPIRNQTKIRIFSQYGKN